MPKLRELSGSNYLDDLNRRFSAMLPLTIKEVNTVRLHKAINIPGLAFYEPQETNDHNDNNSPILLMKQYHDVCTVDLNVHIFCMNNKEQRYKLRQCIVEELNWDEPMQFSANNDHIFPMVKELCQEKGHVTYVDRVHSKIFMLKDADSLPSLPQSNDIQVKPLSRKHLPIVTKHWGFSKHYGTEKVHKAMEIFVDTGLCYGTFVKGELASWVTMQRYGCLAMLVTLPEYRRRGLAKHCVAALCRKQLSMGLTPYLLAEEDNHASQSFFQGIGFKYAGHKVIFVGYKPRQSGEMNES